MPFCPKCRAKYIEGIDLCFDCQVELVDELPPEDEVETINWQILQEVPNEIVGTIIKGVLEDYGVKVYLRSSTIPWYDGILASWKKYNWGELLVPEEDLEEARKIVDEYFASLPSTEQQIDNDE